MRARRPGRHDVIKIWSRRSTILPQFVGWCSASYNGQKHVRYRSERNGGPQVGEFSPDPYLHGHSGDKKAKKA